MSGTRSSPKWSVLAVALLAGAATAHAGADDLELVLTVGTDLTEDACADHTSIEVGYGDQINLCYRIFNHGSETLRFHTLHDDSVERILTLEEIEIPPGGSHQHNRIAAANQTGPIHARWHALVDEPGYTVAQNDPEILFKDGFDGDQRVQFGFVDISGTGEEVIIPENAEWTLVDLPFDFDLYGIISNRVRMIEFGAIGWDPVPGVDNSIRYLPQPIIASLGAGMFPYWTNMWNSGGRLFQQTLGEAPNRRAVLQWHELHYNRSHFPESDTVTFQIVLEEGSNRIQFNYLDAAFGDPAYDYGRAATIGLGSGNGNFRLQYSRLEASLADYLTLRFTPEPVSAYGASAQVQIDVGAPVVAVEPAQLEAAVVAGATVDATLDIGNLGTRELAWSLAEAPARMHFPSTPRVNVARTTAGNGAPLAGNGQIGGRPLGDIQVPAYAWMDTTLEALVRLDAAAPENSLNVIHDSLRRVLLGGDFVDDDFSVLYMLDWNGTQLLRVLTENCHCIDQITVVGSAQRTDGEWVALGYDPTNGWLYGVTHYAGYRRSRLYQIDPDTAQSRELGLITGATDLFDDRSMVQDIAISPEGLMYALEAFEDNLLAIDKVTGEAAVIGPAGIDLPNGYRPKMALDFDDATGVLYMTVNRDIYTVDTATGWARLVGPVGPDAQDLDSLAIATSSPCSHPDDVPWLSLEQGSGSNAPDQWQAQTVSFDSTGLATGDHSANLCVTNNDPLRGRVIVPVTLTVE